MPQNAASDGIGRAVPVNPTTILLEDGREVVLIHFVYPRPNGYGGEVWKIACMPNLTGSFGKTTPNLKSGEVKAVTCPLCKETGEFASAVATYKALMKRRFV